MLVYLYMYLPEIMKLCSLKISQYKTTPEKFVKKGTTHACTNNNFPKLNYHEVEQYLSSPGGITTCT